MFSKYYVEVSQSWQSKPINYLVEGELYWRCPIQIRLYRCGIKAKTFQIVKIENVSYCTCMRTILCFSTSDIEYNLSETFEI